MLKIDCYNCMSDKWSFFDKENGFKIVKCDNCGLLYVNPRPFDKEIKEAHKLGLHQGTYKLDVTGDFNRRKIKPYTDMLHDLFSGIGGSEYLRGKSWIDIGCGHGEFLTALQVYSECGVVSLGIEPNEKKRLSANENGVNVDYFNLDDHNEKYDVISVLNVYSHLPNPPETIMEWRNLLKPGGLILIETGDIDAFKSKQQLRPYSLPDHLSFVSETILVDILNRAGFNLLGKMKYPYPRKNIVSFIKELIKLMLPGKKSKIKYMLNNNYPNTDMYLLAKLK